MKVGPKRPKTWQIFSPQVNHWIPLISPYIKSLISTERGLHEGVGWVRLTSHGNMTSCTDGTFTTTPQKSNELIPKMAIFKAGDAFSKAHHFGSPADSFSGTVWLKTIARCWKTLTTFLFLLTYRPVLKVGFWLIKSFCFFSELQIDRVIGLLPFILYGKWLRNPITLSECSQVFLFWLVDWNGTLGYSRIFNLRLRCLFVWFFRWGWVKKPTKWT